MPPRPARTAPAASPPGSPPSSRVSSWSPAPARSSTRTREHNPDVFEIARVGLGALGILTTVTFAVEPLFLLEAVEQPMSWDEALGSFDDMVAESHHCDMYWFPHTDRLLTKRNTRLDADVVRGRARLAAAAAGSTTSCCPTPSSALLTAGANRVPGVIPRMNQVSARVLSPRTYSDVAHRVFTSPRRVVFREMEYAVPREAGLDALREARRVVDGSDWRISFPVEIRVAPADDIPLSTASGRDSFYLAFHTHHRSDWRTHAAYIEAMEQVMRDHDGRPHWGKLHTPDRCRPGTGVPALRRLPGAARPARPRPGLRQRLPASGSWGPDPALTGLGRRLGRCGARRGGNRVGGVALA